MTPLVPSTSSKAPPTIRIGVTGHRNIPDSETTSALINHALETKVRDLFSHGIRETSMRFTIVSPLAEGADRLLARIVLSRPNSILEVPLPLTLDDYLQDFQTAASRQEFRDLLARCPQPLYLRSKPLAVESQHSDERSALRNAAYEAVGHYVVDHCDLLFALWDGGASRGRGGTAEIVAYALKQHRPIIRIWDGQCSILEQEKSHD